MSKKKKSQKHPKYTLPPLDVERINQDVMPIANDIKSKMEKLQSKFNFKLEFGFPELTMDEILNFKDK